MPPKALPKGPSHLHNLLTGLKRTDLQNLCERVGLLKSGTKPILADRIHAAVHDTPPLPSRARVLSVDLGLRNLAFSLLETPDSEIQKKIGQDHFKKAEEAWGRYQTLKQRNDKRSAEAEKAWSEAFVKSGIRMPPRLLEWNVVALVPPDGAASASDPAAQAAAGAAPTDETFTPSSLAKVAVYAVRKLIMPLKPTHILLERQRWRSGGGPVLEWTLRINSLEAMLHAVLASMRAEGLWKGEVHSVEPRRVASFIGQEGVSKEVKVESKPKAKSKSRKKKGADMLDAVEEVEDVVLESKSGKKQTVKRIKMDEIARILASAQSETPLHPQAVALHSDAVRDKSLYYLQKVKGKKSMEALLKASTSVAVPEDWQRLAKVDDLADSLLQGLVWCEWQRNRGELRNLGSSTAGWAWKGEPKKGT